MKETEKKSYSDKNTNTEQHIMDQIEKYLNSKGNAAGKIRRQLQKFRNKNLVRNKIRLYGFIKELWILTVWQSALPYYHVLFR